MESLCTSSPRNRLWPAGAADGTTAGGVIGWALGWTNGLLRLDSFGVAEYVGLHGVCSSFIGSLGRKSHHLWLGFPPLSGSQPTLTPESKYRFRFHQKPY